MRHTCCTHLINGGVHIKRVMEWMGHSTMSTTMRYMQIRPDSLDEVVAVLEGKPLRRRDRRDDGDQPTA